MNTKKTEECKHPTSFNLCKGFNNTDPNSGLTCNCECTNCKPTSTPPTTMEKRLAKILLFTELTTGQVWSLNKNIISFIQDELIRERERCKEELSRLLGVDTADKNYFYDTVYKWLGQKESVPENINLLSNQNKDEEK